MKIRFVIPLSMRFIALAVAFGFLCARPVHADTVTLVADQWCPYNCAPDSDKPGILVEIAMYALTKAGHKVSYTVMPWARAIEQARQGKYNGIIGAYKDDAPDFVFPSRALAQSSNDFFVGAGESWRYSGVDSLASVPLGVIRDYSYGDELDNYIKKYESDSSRVQIASGEDALDTNVKKLLAGRIVAIVEDKAVVGYHLTKYNLVGKITEAGSFESDDVYIAFSPKFEQSIGYAELLSDAVAELVANGEMTKIRARYGIQ